MRRLTPVAALLALASVAVGAADGLLLLKAGTPVPLVTRAGLDTRTSRQGDRVELVVATDVMADGRVAIPKGAPALAEVARSDRRAYFAQPGRLELRLLYAKAGERIVRLDGEAAAGGGGGVPTAIVSAFIGTFIAGEEGAIPAGTAVTGYVHRDLRLPSR